MADRHAPNEPRHALGTVVLLSLEPWDRVWRRNQHLSAQIVGHGAADRIVFVAPGTKLRHRPRFEPAPGVTVITPHLVLPRHRGGLELIVRELRVHALHRVDVLWVNDAPLGVKVLRAGLPVVYDVTDDWRASDMSEKNRSELVAAEDVLARTATTIVCSEVLRDRWYERYGVNARVIHNGVDARSHANAVPASLPGQGPHVVYVGTLHRERLDVELVCQVARAIGRGTVHLVGPNHLDEDSQRQFRGYENIVFHGAVSHVNVPAWMASADVLICPHRVDEFTVSLDAIKRYEYLASGRPVLSTPTSGFQTLESYDNVYVVERDEYVEVLAALVKEPALTRRGRGFEHDWSIRARDFAACLLGATSVV